MKVVYNVKTTKKVSLKPSDQLSQFTKARSQMYIPVV